MVSEEVKISARRALTRERLLDAALEIFAENGIAGASVEGICGRAGFTRGAFYSNFSTIDEVVVEVMHRDRLNTVAASRAAVAQLDVDALKATGPDGVIGYAVDMFLSLRETRPTELLFGEEIRLYAARNPELAEEYRAVQATTTQALAEVLGRGLQALGARLRVPVETALRVLAAVHRQATISDMIHNEGAMTEAREDLVLILNTLVEQSNGRARGEVA